MVLVKRNLLLIAVYLFSPQTCESEIQCTYVEQFLVTDGIDLNILTVLQNYRWLD